jgi:hypothetical protein
MISSLISASELNDRRVLFLSTYKVAVYHWHKGEFSSSYLFDVNEDGRHNLERYLRETPNIPMHMLVDVYDEEYKRDSIPHVFGTDRNALLKRKIDRVFHDTTYVYTEIQGREERGRRDDRLFLSALTNSELIIPWIKLLDKYKVPLAGINSLPLFTQSLIGSFTEPSDQILVVSLQSISGLRQTFFYKNEFRISRLVQMPRFGTASYTTHINEEVKKILRYLNSLRLTTVDAALDIYFLLAGELLEELKKLFTDSPMVRYHFLDLNDLTEKSGLQRRISTPFGDQYFVHEFLKKPSPNRYATARDMRYFSMRRVRHMMMAASMLLTLGAAIWGGINAMQGLTLKQNSLAAEQKTRFYNQRYDIARSRLPQTPVEPGELRAAVEIIDTLEKYKTTPFETIRVVSRVLDRFPSIWLDDVEWTTTTNPGQPTGSSGAAGGMQTLPAAGTDAAGARYPLYHVAVFQGHLENFDGNYREALSTISEFAEDLRMQQTVYDTRILDLPIDVSSAVNIQGNTRSVAGQAGFSIRLVLGVGNAI